MFVEDMAHLTALDIPNAYGSVKAATGDQTPIPAHRQQHGDDPYGPQKCAGKLHFQPTKCEPHDPRHHSPAIGHPG